MMNPGPRYSPHIPFSLGLSHTHVVESSTFLQAELVLLVECCEGYITADFVTGMPLGIYSSANLVHGVSWVLGISQLVLLMECHYIGTSQLVLLMDCHEGIATNFDDAVSSEIPQIVLMWDVIRDIATCVLMGRYQWAGFVDGLS